MSFIFIVKMYIILFIILVVFHFHVVHLLVDCGYIYKYDTRRNKIIHTLFIYLVGSEGRSSSIREIMLIRFRSIEDRQTFLSKNIEFRVQISRE
jgi:hypothetical protein